MTWAWLISRAEKFSAFINVHLLILILHRSTQKTNAFIVHICWKSSMILPEKRTCWKENVALIKKKTGPPAPQTNISCFCPSNILSILTFLHVAYEEANIMQIFVNPGNSHSTCSYVRMCERKKMLVMQGGNWKHLVCYVAGPVFCINWLNYPDIAAHFCIYL